MINWKSPLLLFSALTVGVAVSLLWLRKKVSNVKVGIVDKLYFYPVKSLKAVEVKEGVCTKLGFEVNGVLDRSFMVVDKNGKLVSQREAPTLVFLTPSVEGNTLTITTPNGESLREEIKAQPEAGAELIECVIHTDSVSAHDCGDKAAKFFQDFLKMPDVRLVHYFPFFPKRKYLKNHPFFIKLNKEHSAAYQDLTPIHLLSNASIDDLNSKIADQQVTALNFRPNILVKGCEAFAEDSWKTMKINEATTLKNVFQITRCILTTNDPETANLTKKEPLVTLRKYRIPKDPAVLKLTGSIPCFGTGCAVLKSGTIRVGDPIEADVGTGWEMRVNF